MYCENRISYRVQEGDSLYKLAKQFHTTVTELILLNAGVNPYNLQVGMRLTICPGEGYEQNVQPPMEENEPPLWERMRMAWLNHVTLTKLYLTSVLADLPGKNAWREAVEGNGDDILSIFAQYYPASAMQTLRSLFEQHLELTDDAAEALKKDQFGAGEVLQNWYTNAEEIAAFLNTQTPAYNEMELQKFLFDHLDMMRQQIEAYLNGEYVTEVGIFLQSQNDILDFADFLASGLMAR